MDLDKQFLDKLKAAYYHYGEVFLTSEAMAEGVIEWINDPLMCTIHGFDSDQGRIFLCQPHRLPVFRNILLDRLRELQRQLYCTVDGLTHLEKQYQLFAEKDIKEKS